ncbi:hypothetical protein ACH5RR_018849 [Cinchona calisaya]|uniref:Uncharacterized protein n=1 Tax=Cinchona calisaya TaxID=153742 RepID=A0ABD2ZMM9_9GENT
MMDQNKIKENNSSNSTAWEEYLTEEEDQEAEEDTLSFCNLTMQEEYYKDSSLQQSPRNSSSAQDGFDFFNNETNPEFFSTPDIIFCGKLLSMHEEEDDYLNEYQKRDYLTMVRSHSFRRPDQYPFFDNERDLSPAKISSGSGRFSSNISNSHAHADSTYHVQKVNITSLTSMSAKSRRRMFMFGPVKFKPEMELSAIKERQGRRRLPMSTPVVDGGEAVASGGGKRSGRNWNIVRSSLRGRGQLTAVFAKSFGCIPAASVGKWVNVAN